MLYDDGTPNHHFIYTYMLGPITGHSEFNTERKNDISRLFQLFWNFHYFIITHSVLFSLFRCVCFLLSYGINNYNISKIMGTILQLFPQQMEYFDRIHTGQKYTRNFHCFIFSYVLQHIESTPDSSRFAYHLYETFQKYRPYKVFYTTRFHNGIIIIINTLYCLYEH